MHVIIVNFFIFSFLFLPLRPFLSLPICPTIFPIFNINFWLLLWLLNSVKVDAPLVESLCLAFRNYPNKIIIIGIDGVFLPCRKRQFFLFLIYYLYTYFIFWPSPVSIFSLSSVPYHTIHLLPFNSPALEAQSAVLFLFLNKKKKHLTTRIYFCLSN